MKPFRVRAVYVAMGREKPAHKAEFLTEDEAMTDLSNFVEQNLPTAKQVQRLSDRHVILSYADGAKYDVELTVL